MRSVHSGWWEHKAFSTMCELQELFSYCLWLVISFTSDSFLSLLPRSILRKRLRASPADFQNTLFLGVALFLLCLTNLFALMSLTPVYSPYLSKTSRLSLSFPSCAMACKLPSGSNLGSVIVIGIMFVYISFSVSQL